MRRKQLHGYCGNVLHVHVSVASQNENPLSKGLDDVAIVALRHVSFQYLFLVRRIAIVRGQACRHPTWEAVNAKERTIRTSVARPAAHVWYL